MIGALRLALRAALAAGASASLGGCCIFGRSYGPSHDIILLEQKGELPSRAHADGTLDLDVCRTLCANLGTISSCAYAEMGEPTAPRVECVFGRRLETVVVREGVDPKDCKKTCGETTETCRELPAGPPGEKVVACLIYTPGGCDISFGHGRRTREAYAHTGRASLARMAHAEAASAIAFRAMARELEEHGAPARLIAAARRSATEEERHAAAMIALGAERPVVRSRRVRARSLYALARENLREGCIGELIGVAFLLHAAAHAPKVELRRTFARIARDELRHAALSLEVHRWAMARLSERQRRRLARTTVRVTRGPAALGFPDDAASAAIVASLRRSLFQSGARQ